MQKALSLLFNAKRVLKNREVHGELPPDNLLLSNAFKMAWPSTLEAFLVSLVMVVDTIMVSKLGAYAISAVGLTNQPKFIFLSIFLSLNVAVSAVVSRRKGEGDKEGANKVLVQAIAMTMLFVVIVTILANAFADDILRIAGTNEETHVPATSYFRIIINGLFFQTSSMVINAAQRGIGNTKIAMRTNLISNGVNVVFNYFLIEGRFIFPALGIQGAAISTVIGTVVAFVISLHSIMGKDSFLSLRNVKKIKEAVFNKHSFRSIYIIGSSSFAEQIFMRIGFFLYVIIVARLGTNAFAAHQIGMNVTTVSFAVGDGLSVAVVALVGRSLGENRPDLARVYNAFCQRLGAICSITIATIYVLFGREITMLFSKDQEVLNYGAMVMKFVGVIVILQVAQGINSGSLRGAGDTKYVAIAMLISVTFIRPISGWIFVIPLNLGLMGAWLGITLDQMVRFILCAKRVNGGKWLDIKI